MGQLLALRFDGWLSAPTAWSLVLGVIWCVRTSAGISV
jgi:hypothetical protein